MDIYVSMVINQIPIELCDMIMNFVCIQNIKNGLQKLKIEPIKFCEMLNQNNNLLAGKFIESCYLNKKINDYINDEVFIEVFGYHNESHKINDYSKFEEYICKLGYYSTGGIQFGHNPLNCIYSYKRTYRDIVCNRITYKSQYFDQIDFVLDKLNYNILFDGANVIIRNTILFN